jgi:hypothetical protein
MLPGDGGCCNGLLFVMVFLVSVVMAYVHLQYMGVCGCTSSLLKPSHVVGTWLFFM